MPYETGQDMPHETNQEQSTTVHVPSGGIMTDEVGAVTGDVDLTSRCDAAGAASTVCRYSGAEEWYTVTDSARKLDSIDQLTSYHAEIVARYI